MSFFKRPKIGLALGSGGPKGLAHIGVIKVLDRYKIPIDYIAGTSAGSIIGASYAFTKNIEKIERFYMDLNWITLIKLVTDPSLREGLFKGKKARDFFSRFFGSDTMFSDLKIPFQAVASDLKSGETISLSKGNVIDAIMASCAIPILFKPVLHNDYILVDGAITSAVPVHTVRKMGAEIVIAVNLEKSICENDAHIDMNLFEVGRRTFSVVAHRIGKEEVKKADIVINPYLDYMHWKSLLSHTEKKRAVESGEKAMEDKINKLHLIISGKEPIHTQIIHYLKNIVSFE